MRVFKRLILVWVLSQFWVITNAQESPFSTDFWIRIRVEESGVYKFDTGTLKKWGFTDPDNISLFCTSPNILSYSDTTNRKLIEIPLQKIDDGDTPGFITYLRGVNFSVYYKKNKYISNFTPSYPYNYYFIRQNRPGQTYIEIDSLPAIPDSTVFITENSHWDGFNLIGLFSGTKITDKPICFSPGFAYTNCESMFNKNELTVSLNKPNRNDTIFLRINEHSYFLIGERGYSIPLSAKGIIDSVCVSGLPPNTDIEIEKISITLYVSNNFWGDQQLFSGAFLDNIDSPVKNNIKYRGMPPSVWCIDDKLIPRMARTMIKNDTLSVFQENGIDHSAYIIFSDDSFKKPTFDKIIENQDLLNSPSCNYLVVAADSFVQEAQNFARFHEQYEGLSTLVVEQSRIFNDYSGGKPDPLALYRFCKSIYQKGMNDSNGLQYILLLGDGNTDMRTINTAKQVPALRPDYFGDAFLSVLSDTLHFDEELRESDMDVVVGRIPAKSKSDLHVYFNKLKLRQQGLKMPNNHYLFVGDKYDTELDFSPTDSIEHIANLLYQHLPHSTIHKVYFDEMKETNKINSKIFEQLNKGMGLICYNGHSNEYAWNQGVMHYDDISKIQNTYFPLLFSCSCAYAPIGIDGDYGASNWLFTPNGGGIALIGLTVQSSIDGSTRFMQNYFANWILDDSIIPGKIFKNTWNQSRQKNFIFLGDPAINFNFPRYNIEQTLIPTGRLECTITSGNNSISYDFEGKAILNVIQSPVVTGLNAVSPTSYLRTDSLVYTDTATVKNGTFQFDISSIYAFNNENNVTIYAISADSSMEAYTTGLQLISSLQTIRQQNCVVYPSPFNEKLSISGNPFINTPTEVIIIGMDGSLVFKKTFYPTDNNITINTSFIPGGAYLISIVNNSLHYCTKVIKIK